MATVMNDVDDGVFNGVDVDDGVDVDADVDADADVAADADADVNGAENVGDGGNVKTKLVLFSRASWLGKDWMTIKCYNDKNNNELNQILN